MDQRTGVQLTILMFTYKFVGFEKVPYILYEYPALCAELATFGRFNLRQSLFE